MFSQKKQKEPSKWLCPEVRSDQLSLQKFVEVFNWYLTNITESPAKSLFPLTKRLQPVVSKWRFGWPGKTQKRTLTNISRNYMPKLHLLIMIWGSIFFQKWLICSPRYMWRKVHTLSCKSLACSSWAGGCIEKSYNTANNIFIRN